ncbi:rhodanese-like domain-containing protein [Streptomyces sp. H27-D2]|uniref:rhodanese-like domain-containing protein n=1 Tax=Streptomyces sp. H27-D2 TaxID=3046304 RepID=UPI002DBF9FA2|nr:rhodanese-like domain-containing protein [Streptomyces sp. H27-D2]MEC4019468.1 rhodanese-like domain-containing protein [Streptomyces sp. H27-D2]
MTTPPAPLTVEDFHPRLENLTVIDVRTPGEYLSGHIPGGVNIPLDRLAQALPALRSAAGRGDLAVVCASGGRSRSAAEQLADVGIPAASLLGGTSAWAERGHPLDRPAGARALWPMERQVRLAAGSLVVLGFVLGRSAPKARLLSAAIGGGLVFSALSDTCGMAAVLSKLPHNRVAADAPDFEDTLRTLKG